MKKARIIKREDVGGITVVMFGYLKHRNDEYSYYYTTYFSEGLSDADILKKRLDVGPKDAWEKMNYERRGLRHEDRRLPSTAAQADKRFQLMCALALSGQVTFKTTE